MQITPASVVIEQAFNGQEAIDMIKVENAGGLHKKCFDIVFMDVNMPVMDGI